MEHRGNPVGWFEIYVSDMARARAFYTAVFDRPLNQLTAPETVDAELWAFPMDMERYGAAGALVRHPMVQPGMGGILIYFSCTDVAIESARVSAHGGRVLRPKMSIGEYGFIALVEDTEGNAIGLHSRQ